MEKPRGGRAEGTKGGERCPLSYSLRNWARQISGWRPRAWCQNYRQGSEHLVEDTAATRGQRGVIENRTHQPDLTPSFGRVGAEWIRAGG